MLYAHAQSRMTIMFPSCGWTAHPHQLHQEKTRESTALGLNYLLPETTVTVDTSAKPRQKANQQSSLCYHLEKPIGLISVTS